MYARFARGLRAFLAHPLSLDEARAVVRRRLDERESNFLRTIERGIYGHPRSPYRRLLALARCELGDAQRLVRTQGLEGALRTLREAGVYITFEEFKGREPLVRQGEVIPVEPHHFDNPYPTATYRTESGGSTGAGTRVDTDLEHLADQAAPYMLAYHSHGVLYAPTAIWRGILPDSSGINNILRHASFGQVTSRWFTPVVARDLRPALKYALATRAILVLGRLAGTPLPWPEPVRFEQAAIVARWMAETLRAHRTCLVRCNVSGAVRICVAAREVGLDLTGAVFIAGGEPPTPGKVQEITRAGARHVAHYTFSEAGHAGAGCARPLDSNDLHFNRASLALIQRSRPVPGSDLTVPAFLFTSLLPSSSKILLNVESDDFGIVEQRSCGCPLEAYGFTEHLREIGSFRKLTGEGVTLVGSEMTRILEDVLPAAFGGTPLDYQLLEEEDEAHVTRLSLLVNPRIAIANEQVVIDAVLRALGQGSVAADLARATWLQARSLRVKRIAPIPTARGKVMPLHSTRRQRPPAAPP
jgi:hypothetical protein